MPQRKYRQARPRWEYEVVFWLTVLHLAGWGVIGVAWLKFLHAYL